MATDKHYNEKGMLPDQMEDDKPNDLPATRNMFVVIALLAAVGLIVAVVYEFTIG